MRAAYWDGVLVLVALLTTASIGEAISCYECVQIDVAMADDTLAEELQQLVRNQLLGGRELRSCGDPIEKLCDAGSKCGTTKMYINGFYTGKEVHMEITTSVCSQRNLAIYSQFPVDDTCDQASNVIDIQTAQASVNTTDVKLRGVFCVCNESRCNSVDTIPFICYECMDIDIAIRGVFKTPPAVLLSNATEVFFGSREPPPSCSDKDLTICQAGDRCMTSSITYRGYIGGAQGSFHMMLALCSAPTGITHKHAVTDSNCEAASLIVDPDQVRDILPGSFITEIDGDICACSEHHCNTPSPEYKHCFSCLRVVSDFPDPDVEMDMFKHTSSLFELGFAYPSCHHPLRITCNNEDICIGFDLKMQGLYQGVNGTFGFLWHGCDNPSAGYYRYTLDERIHTVEEAVDMEDIQNYFDSEVHSSDGIVHMCATELCNTIITDFTTDLVCYECSDVIIDIADETMKAELKSIILDRILGEEHGSCSSPAAVICPEGSTCGSAKLTIEGHYKDEPVRMDITMSMCDNKEAELKEIIKHNECINGFEIFDLDQNSEDINTTTLGTICDCETDKCNSIHSVPIVCNECMDVDMGGENVTDIRKSMTQIFFEDENPQACSNPAQRLCKAGSTCIASTAAYHGYFDHKRGTVNAVLGYCSGNVEGLHKDTLTDGCMSAHNAFNSEHVPDLLPGSIITEIDGDVCACSEHHCNYPTTDIRHCHMCLEVVSSFSDEEVQNKAIMRVYGLFDRGIVYPSCDHPVKQSCTSDHKCAAIDVKLNITFEGKFGTMGYRYYGCEDPDMDYYQSSPDSNFKWIDYTRLGKRLGGEGHGVTGTVKMCESDGCNIVQLTRRGKGVCSFCQQIIPKFDDKKTDAEIESSVLINIFGGHKAHCDCPEERRCSAEETCGAIKIIIRGNAKDRSGKVTLRDYGCFKKNDLNALKKTTDKCRDVTAVIVKALYGDHLMSMFDKVADVEGSLCLCEEDMCNEVMTPSRASHSGSVYGVQIMLPLTVLMLTIFN